MTYTTPDTINTTAAYATTTTTCVLPLKKQEVLSP